MLTRREMLNTALLGGGAMLAKARAEGRAYGRRNGEWDRNHANYGLSPVSMDDGERIRSGSVHGYGWGTPGFGAFWDGYETGYYEAR